MIELGCGNPRLSYDNILTLISPASKYDKVMHISSHSMEYQTDWFKGFSSKIRGSFNHYYSTQRGFEFQRYNGEWRAVNGFNTNELSAEFRYCANHQYAENYGIRTFRPIPKPGFSFKYTWGIKNPLTGDYAYHKLEVSGSYYLHAYRRLWQAYRKAGMILGDAPFPATFISGAKKGIFRDETAYQLISFFHFLSFAGLEKCTNNKRNQCNVF
jgi:hypothetical protein